MSASPVPPGAPLELDAIEARANARKAARTFGEAMQADIIFTNAARTDIPALCAEVRRLRAALEEIATSAHQSYEHYRGDGTTSSTSYNTGCADGHRCAGKTARAALAPTGEPGNG